MLIFKDSFAADSDMAEVANRKILDFVLFSNLTVKGLCFLFFTDASNDV